MLQPAEHESLTGFLLRASPPGGGLHPVRAALKLTGTSLPAREDLDALARLLQTPAGDLEQRFSGRDRTSKTYQYGTGYPVQGSHLRGGFPQVCALCLHESRPYCRRVWELSLVTVCTRHSCWLTDMCGACMKPLRWDRPSLSICRCRRPLTSPRQESLDAHCVALSVALQGLSEGRPADLFNGSPQLAAVVRPLSVGGLMALIHALGDFSAPFERPRQSATTRAMPCKYWQAVTGRGLRRLAEWGAGRDVACYLNPAILRSYARVAVSAADRSICRQFVQSGARNSRSRAQHELFPGI